METSTSGSLSASGVIDAHTADDLAAALDSQGLDGDVHLDLTGIEFIDSSGLRALVVSHQALDGAGRRLVLSGVSEAAERLFEITGLRDHLHIA